VFFLVVGICVVDGAERRNQTFAQAPIRTKPKFPALHRPFGISNENVDGFETFQWIYIGFRKGEDWTNAVVDSEGKIFLSGFVQAKDGKKYTFHEASLRRDGDYFKYLSAMTESIGGIRYEINGCFFEKPQSRGSYYVDMTGQLRKFVDDVLLLEREFEFSDVSDEEINF
jgi:hypothetical protein